VPLVINGWTVLYHTVFGDRFHALKERVKQLKATLSDADYKQHPDVKLFAAVRRVIMETIPTDPNRADFWLRADLAKFRRVKGYGLPERYRVFYVFSQQARVVMIMYLNGSGTLRKQGAKTDPYEVFADLVRSGELGADFEANLAQWKAAHGSDKGKERT